MRKKMEKRMVSIEMVLILLLMFALSGCRKEDLGEPWSPRLPMSEQQDAGQRDEPEMVWGYAVERLELDTRQWMADSEMRLDEYSEKQIGDWLYYIILNVYDEETGKYGFRIYRYNLLDGTHEPATKILYGWKEFGGSYDIKEDGTVYGACFSRDMGTDEMTLWKYNAAGEEVYKINLAAVSRIPSIKEAGSVVALFADDDGRVCLVCGKKLLYFDEYGRFLDSMEPDRGKKLLYFDEHGRFVDSMESDRGRDAEVLGACRGKDGGIFVIVADRENGQEVLMEADFDRRQFRTVDENFMQFGPMSVGVWRDLLVNDNADGMMYDYDKALKKREKLFCWNDFGYSQSSVTSLGVTSDGRIAATVRDSVTRELAVLLFDKKMVPRRQEIILGTVCADSMLWNEVAKFNRENDRYFVTVWDYALEKRVSVWNAESGKDFALGLRLDLAEESEKASAQGAGQERTDQTGEKPAGVRQKLVQEAWKELEMELASGEGPDIIDFSYEQIQEFAAQGVLEDLAPYLEQSRVIGRESFVGRVLECGVCDGHQTAIPKRFQVETIAGLASNVGARDEWTLEEFMSLVEQRTGAQVLGKPGKENLLDVCMRANIDTFVDKKTGKSSFDFPEFVRLLEFADRYGDVTAGGDSSMSSYVERTRQGNILLEESCIDESGWIQFCDEKFAGDAGIVGYPSSDGNAAHYILVTEMCGISANSQHKDGAWAFVEYYVGARYMRDKESFPAVQSCLDDLLQEEMRDLAYKTDEVGDLVLDENGRPVLAPREKRGKQYEGWQFYYDTLKSAESERLMKIFDTARPESLEDIQIRAIIDEEAADFFDGTKSATQAAGAIQRRVQAYLDGKGS